MFGFIISQENDWRVGIGAKPNQQRGRTVSQWESSAERDVRREDTKIEGKFRRPGKKAQS